MPDGARFDAVVTGDRDPGYGSTSKMIAESGAVPGARRAGRRRHVDAGRADGRPLRQRLVARAGLTFTAG